MAEDLDLTFAGLHTSTNPFAQAPKGAMEQADNVVIRDKSLLEPRRGYSQGSAPPSGALSRAFPWLVPTASPTPRLAVFAANGDFLTYNSGNGAWSTAISSGYSPPDADNPIRAAVSNKSLYWTTSKGVYVNAQADTTEPAGLPPPFRVTWGRWNSGSWLANYASLRFCAVLCRYDNNGYLIQSAPSPSWVATNTTGTAQGGADVTVYLPFNLNGGTFVQLYRSIQSAPLSGNVATTPSEEMFLVAEHTITSSDVTAGYCTITDTSTDPDAGSTAAIGPPLYTNGSTGSGFTSSNVQPPLARDLCDYNGVLIYANTTERQSVSLTMLGVQNMAVGSTITVAGVTYTAAATADYANGKFLVTSNGTAAQNIYLTSFSLASCISVYNYLHPTASTTQVVAYIVSGATDNFGNILIQEVGVGGSAFSVTVGDALYGTDFAPVLDPVAAVWSSNNREPAKIWWSNQGISQGVGPDNWAIIGDRTQGILRVLRVRRTVFIFKKDGLYTLQGDTPSNYDIRPFDPGLQLICPESASVADNAIFCYTNKGAVYVSESGVSHPIDGPIERDLLTAYARLASAAGSPYVTSIYGVGYDADGLWVLAIPSSANAPGADWQYVFNIKTQTWTRWTLPATVHGCVDPNNNGLAFLTGSYVWNERRNFDSTDFQDPGLFNVACPATGSSSTLTFPGGNPGLGVGDLVTQRPGSGQSVLIVARVTAVSGGTITFDAAYPWSSTGPLLGSSKAIASTWRHLPIVANDPLFEKVFNTAVFSFKWAEFPSITVGFDSDRVNTTSSTSKTGPYVIPFGSYPWGSFPWGAQDKNWILRADVSQSIALASTLGLTTSIQAAQCFWQLQGVKLLFEPGSDLPRRG